MSIAVMNNVWEYSDAKGSELLLLIALADIARDNGIAWPSQIWLAQRTRLSERQVVRLLQNANERGEIEIRSKRGYGNTYWIKIYGPSGPDYQYCKNCGAIEDPHSGFFLHEHHYDSDSENTITLCEPCHNEGHGKTTSDKMSHLRKEAFKVTPGATQLTFPSEKLTPMSHNTLNTSKETSKNTRSNDRNSNNKNQIRKELAEYFSSKTGLEVPNPTTDKQRRETGTLWYSPIREMCELSGWNVGKGKKLIDLSLERMDGLTVCSPNSILKTAKAIVAQAKIGKGELRQKEFHEMTPGEFTEYLSRRKT